MVQAPMKDPVETKPKGKKTEEEELKTFDISNLSIEDFKPLHHKTAVSSHPFDGYPREMTQVGTFMKNGKETPLLKPAYSIVALNPKEPVFQDPSGVGLTIRDPLSGKTKVATIGSNHSRSVPNYEDGGQNTVYVFDREIKLADGRTLERVCFVESHSARAQLLFSLDRTGERIQIDNRYILLDSKQGKRLRRLFEMIVNPKIHKARLAKAISGESDEDLDDIPEK